MPIFNLVIGLRFLPHERVAATRVGLGLGVLGVAVLAGLNPVGGWWAAAGTLAVVVLSISYAAPASTGNFASGPSAARCWRRIDARRRTDPLPAGIAQAPTERPGTEAIRPPRDRAARYGDGAARALPHAAPPRLGTAQPRHVSDARLALFYGALLLDEPVTASVLVGLALILLGVALASGYARFAAGGRYRPGVSVSIRRAREDDVDFLVELLSHEEVEPYLAAVRPRDAEGIAGLVERSEREPDAYGLFVIELDERAGTMDFELVNRRSAIASVGGLAVHPRLAATGG